MERHFYIIGVGTGACATLTGEARDAICDADAVFSTARLAELMSALRKHIMVCGVTELAAHAACAKARKVAVLVSGDVGFFSAAKQLGAQLAPLGETTFLCGLSSLQYFCAKIGESYDDVCVRSVHGRTGSVLGAVSYHTRVFALTGGAQTAQTVCHALARAGLGTLLVYIGENLGAKDERISSGTAEELARMACGDLAVMLILNPHAANAHAPIFDHMLERGATPMTKEDVRWVSVARLALRADDIVYDVGAGTGAVTLEMARHASNGMVYAIERKPDAVQLLARNRVALGGYNVCQIEGEAPDALAALPAPDAAFLGGSGGHMREILALLLEKNPRVRVVVNAIALETLHEALDAMRTLGFLNIEVTQLSSARGKAVGQYTMMMANNPIFIISGVGAHAD